MKHTKTDGHQNIFSGQLTGSFDGRHPRPDQAAARCDLARRIEWPMKSVQSFVIANEESPIIKGTVENGVCLGRVIVPIDGGRVSFVSFT
jgi:hypothetical protein